MAHRVAGESFERLTGQLFEIERQLRQKSGYSFDPEGLKRHLQAGIEGEFVVLPNHLLSVDYFVRPSLDGFKPLDNRRDIVRIDLRRLCLVMVDNPSDQTYIEGKECLRRFRKQSRRDKFTLLDVRVMEELLKRPHLIPEEWRKGDPPCFLGNITESGHIPVLVWSCSRWTYGYSASFHEHGEWMPKKQRAVALMKDA